MIQQALYGFLSTDPGVTALVNDRIYPLVIPDQVFDASSKRPCLVYAQDGLTTSQTFCETIALRSAGFMIDCYARRYEDAIGLAEAVKSALVDFRGPMGSSQISNVDLISQYDLMDLEPGLFRVALRFSIWHAG